MRVGMVFFLPIMASCSDARRKKEKLCMMTVLHLLAGMHVGTADPAAKQLMLDGEKYFIVGVLTALLKVICERNTC